jgi:phenylalanyl-tRNA synthetase beta chain
MRLSLLPGLLNCARRNISRRNLSLALFEMGALYVPAQENPAGCQPQEVDAWGLLLSGAAPPSWQAPGPAYDYFYAKGLIEAVAAAFNGGPMSFKRAPAEQYPYLHPGRSALIVLDERELGFVGELDPRAAANYDVPAQTVVAEIFLAPLFKAARAALCADLPKYPAIERDIALVGSAEIEASEIEKAIRAAGEPLLEQIRLFDIYAGPPIAKGQRSLAYALSFRDAKRTLTDAEADAAMESILRVMEERYGLKLR